MSNIYSKLNDARVILASKDIKKSGMNKHLGFRYMELDDFMPYVKEINKEIGIHTHISISEDGAVLVVVNVEKPDETIPFKTHIAQAKLQGTANPIQELGALHTYIRRYLYMLAYEITEPDTLDGAMKDNKSEDNRPWLNNIQEVYEYAKRNGLQKASAIEWAKKNYKISNKTMEQLERS